MGSLSQGSSLELKNIVTKIGFAKLSNINILVSCVVLRSSLKIKVIVCIIFSHQISGNKMLENTIAIYAF